MTSSTAFHLEDCTGGKEKQVGAQGDAQVGRFERRRRRAAEFYRDAVAGRQDGGEGDDPSQHGRTLQVPPHRAPLEARRQQVRKRERGTVPFLLFTGASVS